MSTVVTKNVQVGTSGTATNNFTLYQPASPDGTVRLANGNSGSTTDLVTVNSSGNVGIGTTPGVKLDVKPADLGTTVNDSTYAYRATTSTVGNTDQFDVLWYRTASAAGWSNADLILQRNVDGSAGQSKIIFGGSNYTAFWTNSAERARIDSSGRLLVACTSVPNVGTGQTGFSVSTTEMVFSSSTNGGNALSYWRTQSGNSFVSSFWNGTNNVGNIAVTTSTTSYNSGSDYRLKNNIRPLTGALERVAALKPVAFEWKADGVYGESFVAHELQEVCPQAVTGEKDAVDAEGNPRYQGSDTSFLVATLTAAIQEQQDMIEQLKADVAALKATQPE